MPYRVGEELDRAREVERLGLLYEADRVTALAAAEAVVELLLDVDRERRRALVMERAQPDHPAAGTPQLGASPDQLDHVHGVLDALDRFLRVTPN